MSGYSKEDNRPLPNSKKKKVIRLVKDELGGKIMIKFVALRAKMYRMLNENKPEDKKCKGTKKCVVANSLTFEDYKKCLFDGKTVYREQVLFEHEKHDVFTVNNVKLR